jgi:DNA-binding CsgD family transcriptional regulator
MTDRGLDAAAAAFYDELGLARLLDRLLDHNSALLGALAGSISLVDAGRGSYAKVAEHGASCQLGRTFPLEQGVTGQVMARRRPVVLDRYSDVRSGHLQAAHPASSGAVAAVPIWWRGEVIGANVAFAGPRPCFTSQQVDELEMLTQVAAPGIVSSARSDPSLAHIGDDRPCVDRRPPSPFTPREREVVALLARGLSDRDIAEAFVISRKTAEKHVGAVLRKTGTTSRTAAVLHVLERGWLQPDGTRPNP